VPLVNEGRSPSYSRYEDGGTVILCAQHNRIQGPRLLAEYDNTTRDGNHVHTVWRDPVNDFGADVLADHHRKSH